MHHQLKRSGKVRVLKELNIFRAGLQTRASFWTELNGQNREVGPSFAATAADCWEIFGHQYGFECSTIDSDSTVFSNDWAALKPLFGDLAEQRQIFIAKEIPSEFFVILRRKAES